MRRIIILSVTTAAIILSNICSAGSTPDKDIRGQASSPQAATSEPNDSNEPRSQKAAVTRRPRLEAVTMAEFYMRDGNSVSGRLLSEDNTQVIIEQPLDSTLVTKAISKRELDPRTLKTRPMQEWQYYSRLGEYFAARTWDFRDDPDDFIGAIRSYEKAKQSLQASGADEERIADIERTIKKIESDRDVWAREVETRAKLKKFEYEAEAENRLKQLEKQAIENNVRLNESIKYLEKSAADMKGEYDRLEKVIANVNKDLIEQIRILQVQVQENRAGINDLYNRLFLSSRPAGGG